MTIKKTMDRIESYGQEIDARLDTLAGMKVPPMTMTKTIGPNANSTDILFSVYADQIAAAAAHLSAVHSPCQRTQDAAGESGKAETVIDAQPSEYKDVSGGS